MLFLILFLGITALLFFWFIGKFAALRWRDKGREFHAFAWCVGIPSLMFGSFVGDKLGLNGTEWAMVIICMTPFGLMIYFVRCLITGRL